MRALKMMALAALVVAPLLSGSARADDALDRIRQAKVIRIGVDPNLPPWSYKNDKLEMAGSEIETARLLAQDLGVAIEMVPISGGNRVPLLLAGKADIVVAAMAMTPERAKVVDFSIPYAGTSIVVAAPEAMAIRTPADLAGHRVGVARGTSNDQALTAQAPAGTDIVRFEDEATTMESVLSGQLDVVAESVTLNDTINRRDPTKRLETKLILRNNLLAMGLQKNNPALKAWLDAWIRTNMANGKLKEIFRRNQGVDLPEEVVKAAT